MPFSPTASERNWTEVFERVFQPSLEDCGYSCKRAETSRGSLIASIVEGLVEADLVIADVTDRNANVFYELGVRHSLRRGTIIVSQGTDHVPSDLRGYWFLPYGLRPAEVAKFKADIKRIVAAFEEHPKRSDSPVSDYLDREPLVSQDDFHTFCGLKEPKRGDGVFQDFEVVAQGGNISAVQFLWADSFRGSKIHAFVRNDDKCLRIEFKNERGSYPSNVAIRAKGETALANSNRQPFLGFEARIPSEASSKQGLLKKVSVSMRVVNGWMQHWEYGDRPREPTKFSVEGPDWERFNVNLDKTTLWNRFDADGNHLGAPLAPDFSVICCVIFEFGAPNARGLPGPGKGMVEVRKVQLYDDTK